MHSFAGRNTKETGVEAIHVIEKSTPARVRFSGSLGIGIEICVDVPTFRRYFADRIHTVTENFPERFGRGRAPGKAASDADHRDGFIGRVLRRNSVRNQRRLCFRFRFEVDDFAVQVMRQGVERRVIEQQSRGQHTADRSAYGVAQFHGHQRIEASLAEGLLRIDNAARGQAQHLGCLIVDVGEQNAVASAAGSAPQNCQEFRVIGGLTAGFFADQFRKKRGPLASGELRAKFGPVNW